MKIRFWNASINGHSTIRPPKGTSIIRPPKGTRITRPPKGTSIIRPPSILGITKANELIKLLLAYILPPSATLPDGIEVSICASKFNEITTSQSAQKC